MRINAIHRWLVTACILAVCSVAVIGQYKGDPVKKERLINVLRSKQFQTRDIVQIITESGVDFRLNAAGENELVAAGARPAVLDAVRRHFRGQNRSAATARGGTSGGEAYNSLINQAVEAYDLRKDMRASKASLQSATVLQPNNPRAFQLLGFMSLYGEKDFDQAEANWKKAISLGGAAVLRLTHDHDGSFLKTCQGSLYIARNIVRFESDNNEHTFETTDANIKSIDVNNKWRRMFQLKQGSFKISLKREEKSSYSFAPLTGKTNESKMIISLIGK
ncbi:MAG: hypothetical protein ABL984_07020 [Pyrinomonadaceae bacterium]